LGKAGPDGMVELQADKVVRNPTRHKTHKLNNCGRFLSNFPPILVT
jgi:hypothetical protein